MQRLDLLALIMTVLFLVLGLTKADLPAAENQRAVSIEADSNTVGMITPAAQLRP